MIIKASTWLSLTPGEQMSALQYAVDQTAKKWAKKEGKTV